MLELGTGFHPELTGRENVFVSGIISGLTRADVRERFDDIVAFAELEAFIDSPYALTAQGCRCDLLFQLPFILNLTFCSSMKYWLLGTLLFSKMSGSHRAVSGERGCAHFAE